MASLERSLYYTDSFILINLSQRTQGQLWPCWKVQEVEILKRNVKVMWLFSVIISMRFEMIFLLYVILVFQNQLKICWTRSPRFDIINSSLFKNNWKFIKHYHMFFLKLILSILYFSIESNCCKMDIKSADIWTNEQQKVVVVVFYLNVLDFT